MQATSIIKSLSNYFNATLPASLGYPERFTVSLVDDKFILDTTQHSQLISKLQNISFRNKIEQSLLQGIKRVIPGTKTLTIIPDSLSRFSVVLGYSQLTPEDVYVEIINSLDMTDNEIRDLARKDEVLVELLYEPEFLDKIGRSHIDL